MTALWIRRVKVTLEGKAGKIEIENLKIDFDVECSSGSSQNKGKVTIWNLSRAHRGQLGEEYDSVTLEAGYEGGPFGIILKGDIRDVENSLEDGAADVSSVIEVGDGDKAVNKGAVSKTFPKGSKPKEIAEYLTKQMPGTTKGSFVGLDDLPPTKRPYTVFGFAAKEMDKLGRENGFYWSIQKGHVEAIKGDRYIDDRQSFDPQSGLIGTPTATDKGVKAKVLLHPKLAPNRVIEIKSPFLDESGKAGSYRISTVSFKGSNRDKDFYAEVEGNKISGGKVVK